MATDYAPAGARPPAHRAPVLKIVGDLLATEGAVYAALGTELYLIEPTVCGQAALVRSLDSQAPASVVRLAFDRCEETGSIQAGTACDCDGWDRDWDCPHVRIVEALGLLPVPACFGSDQVETDRDVRGEFDLVLTDPDADSPWHLFDPPPSRDGSAFGELAPVHAQRKGAGR